MRQPEDFEVIPLRALEQRKGERGKDEARLDRREEAFIIRALSLSQEDPLFQPFC